MWQDNRFVDSSATLYHMRGIDPYTPSESVYECYDCGHRVTVEGHRGECPECPGEVRNIAVPRE